MATKWYSPKDANLLELLNHVLHKIAGAPGAATEGQVWYDTVAKRLKFRSDTADIDPTARANHSGTQLASTVSDFDTQVRTSRLDQMAAPTGSLSANSQKIVNLANGTAPADAVNFGQLEAARQGIVSKYAVEAAMATNVTVSNPGTAVFDGVTLANGERLLLAGQTTTAENGIYVFNGSGAALTRADDADTFAEVDAGTETFTQGGTANGGKVWRQLTELTAFTGQVWSPVATATTYVAGDGLTESPAGTFNVGEGAGIDVTANAVAIDTAVVVRKFATDNINAAATVATHNFNTRDVTVAVYRTTTPWDEVEVDVEHTDVNNVTCRWATAPAAGAFRIVVHG